MPIRTIDVGGAERPYVDLFTWIAPATGALLPATVVPAGRTAGGLPVGLQVVGPYLEDRTTIAAGAAIADVIGGFEPAPALR
jgi:amidase